MEEASLRLSQATSLNQSKIKGNSDAFHSELIYSRDREVTRTKKKPEIKVQKIQKGLRIK